jgi:hypothetical protein
MPTKGQLLDLLTQGERAGCVARCEVGARVPPVRRLRFARNFSAVGSRSC